MPSAVLDTDGKLDEGFPALSDGHSRRQGLLCYWSPNILVAWETPQRDTVSPSPLIEHGMSTLLRHKCKGILLSEKEISPTR